MAAEDHLANLNNYQIQLTQVEAALTNDSTNDELLKLKKDLEEVIFLTKELITASNAEKATSEASSSKERVYSTSRWKAGDKCFAPWSDDGDYYEATIDSISEEGQVFLTFSAYGNKDTCEIEYLRPAGKHASKPESSSLSKKKMMQAQRDYKKKKAQKKVQKMKQIEEEREQEKMKWHSFNTKAFHKKGHIKKSIFATPDNVNGRVGIGTCGIGGRPMTEFQHQEKWKKPISGPLAKVAALKGQSSSHM